MIRTDGYQRGRKDSDIVTKPFLFITTSEVHSNNKRFYSLDSKSTYHLDHGLLSLCVVTENVHQKHDDSQIDLSVFKYYRKSASNRRLVGHS